MTTFKANRKFPNPITVTDDPKSHTLALQQIIEALNIGQRRTKEIGSSYVRVSELVDMGLIEIVGSQLKLTNGASSLDDLADVSFGVPSDGDVLTYDSATSKWGAAAASGGSSLVTPDDHPASPNAMDDEFDGSSLGGIWSWANQDGSSVSFPGGGAIAVYRPAKAGDNVSSIVQAISGSSWTLRAKIAVKPTDGTNGSNYMGGGLLVRNSSGPKNVTFGPFYVGGWALYSDRRSDTAYAGAVVSASSSLWFPHYSSWQYLEIELSAGTLYLRQSNNGITYQQVATEPVASYLSSITDVGVFGFIGNGSYGIYTIADWFRKVA